MHSYETAGAMSPFDQNAGVTASIDDEDAPEREDAEEPGAPTVNPFVITDHDPLSTFAVDVDTASYDIFRQHANAGQLPPQHTVRTEEFINAFDYDYFAPAPEDGAPHPFALDVEVGPSPFRDTTLMRVGVRGRVFDAANTPANIVWLLDVSGSMQSQAKLPLVKSFMTAAMDSLPPESTMSIVTYAGFTKVALGPTPVSQKDLIIDTLNGLSAGGSTAGGAGIDLAYEQAQLGKLAEGINVVILCSDGDFNVGPSSTSDLLDLIEEKRKTGVMLSVYGFGMSNLNDSMFEAVSNAGNGTYAVISNEEQAIEYAHNNLIQNITYVAQDVKIQVAFNPEKVRAYRLLGYENRAIADEDFTDDRVDAGEIGSDHNVTALYELVIGDAEVPDFEGTSVDDGPAFDPSEDPSFIPADEDALVDIRLRYKTVGASEEDPAMQVDYTVTPVLLNSDFESTSADLRWSTMIAAWAEILRDSPFAADYDISALEALAQGAAGLRADRMEFIQLLAKAKDLMSP